MSDFDYLSVEGFNFVKEMMSHIETPTEFILQQIIVLIPLTIKFVEDAAIGKTFTGNFSDWVACNWYKEPEWCFGDIYNSDFVDTIANYEGYYLIMPHGRSLEQDEEEEIKMGTKICEACFSSYKSDPDNLFEDNQRRAEMMIVEYINLDDLHLEEEYSCDELLITFGQLRKLFLARLEKAAELALLNPGVEQIVNITVDEFLQQRSIVKTLEVSSCPYPLTPSPNVTPEVSTDTQSAITPPFVGGVTASCEWPTPYLSRTYEAKEAPGRDGYMIIMGLPHLFLVTITEGASGYETIVHVHSRYDEETDEESPLTDDDKYHLEILGLVIAKDD